MTSLLVQNGKISYKTFLKLLIAHLDQISDNIGERVRVSGQVAMRSTIYPSWNELARKLGIVSEKGGLTLIVIDSPLSVGVFLIIV